MRVSNLISIIIITAIALVVVGAFVVSLILLIRDGKNAKKEGRNRKAGYIAFFIVSTILLLIAVCFALLFAFLAFAVMRGM